MCSLLFLPILTGIFKSSLDSLKNSKVDIFRHEPPPPIKTLPVFSMAADEFKETLCAMRVFDSHDLIKRTTTEEGEVNVCD